MDCSTLGFPVLHCLLGFVQTHVHRVGDAIQPSQPLLPPSPLVPNLSQHQVFSQCVGSSHQVIKILELELQHQPSSSEYSGLISFGIDGFDLLAVPGPLKSLLRHHNSKASILQCSAFFDFPAGSVVKNPPAVQEVQV